MKAFCDKIRRLMTPLFFFYTPLCEHSLRLLLTTFCDKVDVASLSLSNPTLCKNIPTSPVYHVCFSNGTAPHTHVNAFDTIFVELLKSD